MKKNVTGYQFRPFIERKILGPPLPKPNFAPDSTGTTTGTEGTTTGTDTSPITKWITAEQHRPGLLARIADAEGDLSIAIQTLWGDNVKAREQAREARTAENKATAEAAKLRKQIEADGSADGSLTLTADEAADWKRYLEIGNPQDIQTQLDSGGQASAQLAGYQREELIRQSAQLAGYNPDVLIDLDRARPGLEWEITTADDGTRSAIVKAGETKVPLPEFAKAQWATYLPVLTGRGATFPVQPTTSQATNGDTSLAGEFLKTANRQPGPSRVAIATNTYKPDKE